MSTAEKRPFFLSPNDNSRTKDKEDEYEDEDEDEYQDEDDIVPIYVEDFTYRVATNTTFKSAEDVINSVIKGTVVI